MRTRLVVALAGCTDYGYYPNVERTLDKLRERIGPEVDVVLAHNDMTGVGFLARMYAHSRKLASIIVPTDSHEHTDLLLALTPPAVAFCFNKRDNERTVYLAEQCGARGIPVHSVKPHPNELAVEERAAKRRDEVTA